MSILRMLWISVGTMAAVATLPGSVELLFLTVAALWPARRRAAVRSSGSLWRVAVVVPAYNEEAGIAGCIQSLMSSDREGMQVDFYVVADNCTDHTAEVARRAGARVFIRSNELERGKGFALHYAFSQLEPQGYDCVLVVDADTSVATNFISATAGVLRAGASAAQSRYLVKNLDESPRTRLMGLALRAFNVVRPLGRERLHLSVGILGNGFGLRSETLKAVPYLASSVVEDLEFHLALVRSGRRVVFVNETTVFGEMPSRGAGVRTQRSRWEGGRLRMLAEKGPELLCSVLSRRFTLLEPLLELLLLPLAFHAALLAVVISTPSPVIRGIGLAEAGIVLIHLVAAIVIGGGNWRDVAALGIAPFYVIWKILLIPSLLRHARSTQAWVRTSREQR